MGTAIWTLRLMGAFVFIVFGSNQLRHPVVWMEYVPQWLRPWLAVRIRRPREAQPRSQWDETETFLRVHALGNIMLGVWLLSGVLLKVAAGLAVIWMATIVLMTYLVGQWRITMRDFSITLGLLALFLLT